MEQAREQLSRREGDRRTVGDGNAIQPQATALRSFVLLHKVPFRMKEEKAR